MQTPYGKTSPCAYGVTEWNMGDLTPTERWHHPDLNAMRLEWAQGKVPDPCQKCINEERANKQSLRQRTLSWYPNAYQDQILTGRWQQGPLAISTKVSNVCNIACRSCAGWDTNKYRAEGEHYLKVYGTKHPNTPGNRFIPRLAPRHTDYRGFFDLLGNLIKLEFFGGEPLLNLTHIDLLEHLVEIGRSKHVTIFYSTNCTQPVHPRLLKVWPKFKKIEINLSIDGIGHKFEYLRWPGRWSDVQKNVQDMICLPSRLDIDMTFCVAACATLNNVYDIDELIDWANDAVGACYINMVAFPHHLAVHVAPDWVKSRLLDHVKCQEARGFMQIKNHDPLLWKQWIIWNKRQDLYRQEDFRQVFPEYYDLIRSEWDRVTDLSEENFWEPSY